MNSRAIYLDIRVKFGFSSGSFAIQLSNDISRFDQQGLAQQTAVFCSHFTHSVVKIQVTQGV
jgi:hypothetical protein